MFSVNHVLIKGGGEYIASHAAKLLARTGCACVVPDDLSIGHPGAVPRDALVAGDIADVALRGHVLETHKIDAVIRFAGTRMSTSPCASRRSISTTTWSSRWRC